MTAIASLVRVLSTITFVAALLWTVGGFLIPSHRLTTNLELNLHALLMISAFHLLLPLAIVSFHPPPTPRATRKQRHLLLALCTVLTALAGLAAIATGKLRAGKTHLHSVHSLVGALALAALLAQHAGGYLAYAARRVALPVDVHARGGVVVVVLATVAGVAGVVYKAKGAERGVSDVVGVGLALVGAAVVAGVGAWKGGKEGDEVPLVGNAAGGGQG